ncbi:MAG: M56 family metallopeptidase [Archangium sp.]|nr:M56 family metallopeptidase [Archangium sp.]
MIPDASSFLDAPSWLLALVDTASRVTLILFAAGAVALVLNRAAANVRHFVWQLAIVACLLVPVATLVLPRFELKVLPARETPSQTRPATVPFEWPARSPVASRSQWAGWDDVRPRAVVPSEWTRAPIGDAPTAPSETVSGFTLPKLRIDQWLMLVWLAGVLAVLEWTLIDRIRVFFLAQRSRDVVDERRDVFMRSVLKLGVESKAPWGDAVGWPFGSVRFVEADIELPMTWGVVEATVAVPMSSREWPEERLEAVLLHELAHVRRRDTLTQFLAQLACAAYWFHPMVWFAARQLRVLREYACDDEVITHGVRPSSYAEELLQLVQNVKRRDTMSGATLAMARKSHFKERLFAMLDPAVRRARLAKPRAWSMAIMAVVLTASLVVVQPAAADTPKSKGGTLPRLTPKESAQRQVTPPPDAPAPAPFAAPPPPPRLPRTAAPIRSTDGDVTPPPDIELVAGECDEDGEGDGEASVRARIETAVRTARDDSSLGTALKRIAHEEDLDDEATRQAYLAAMSRITDDLARWVALEGLLVGAPISEQTGAGVMAEARKFSRDAERVAFLHRMHTIRESELVRGPYANDYLDLAAKLQSQEALSDALRELLHPSPVEQAAVERALGLAASLDGDLLAPVLIEVTDHQQLAGNVPALYGALLKKLDGRLQADAQERWDEAAASNGKFFKRFAWTDKAAARDAMKEYSRAMRDAAKQTRDELRRQAEDRRREAEARREQAEQAREYADQLRELQREKERLDERAQELKNEAIQLESQMRELKKTLKVKVKSQGGDDFDIDVDE